MYSLAIISFLLILGDCVFCQLISPCPRIFRYEPQTESDRWYGEVTIISDADLGGVWFRLILDKPSIQLANWFGIVKTDDNKIYRIQNREYKLKANTPLKIRLFVRYNPDEPPPKVVELKLNARTICPEGGAATEAPTTTGQLFSSSELSTTSRPFQENAISGNTLTASDNRPFSRPSQTSSGSFRCGVVVTKANPLISHGQNTFPGQWPWHAALYHSRGVHLTYNCGGTLISELHIVTAAHCVTKPLTNEVIDRSNILIYLGKYNLLDYGPDVQERDAAEIFVHPAYNSGVFFNDIAVIKLSKPVKITNFVRPACLWEEENNLESVLGREGVVVGWGFDENRKLSDKLMQASMPIVSFAKCLYSNRDFFAQFIFEKNFCAGFLNGTSVCNGDSGGGMVFPKKGTGGQYVWQIRGLVSIGVALQGQAVCDTSQYIVFTDVAMHNNWIRQVLAT